MFRPTRAAAATLFAVVWATSASAQSSYPLRPDDPRAVYLTKEQFGAHADGVGDDADALQQAIDRVQETTRQGVVFVPQGTYRLGKTVYVWQGIRLIGYGEHRPVFLLGRNTPGFQEGTGHYMVHFADNRPRAGGPLVDASEFTFFSGMSNIDFELQEGNPAAVAVRFHVAQHSTLTHMTFHAGLALAALEDIGNQASDIHIFGGTVRHRQQADVAELAVPADGLELRGPAHGRHPHAGSRLHAHTQSLCAHAGRDRNRGG